MQHAQPKRADKAERLSWSRPWDLIANGAQDVDHWRVLGPAAAVTDMITG